MLFRKLRNRNAPLPVIALVESAEGVLGATDIATAAPTSALVFGAEDPAGNIGATRSAQGRNCPTPANAWSWPAGPRAST